jgi:hypothetical protein
MLGGYLELFGRMGKHESSVELVAAADKMRQGESGDATAQEEKVYQDHLIDLRRTLGERKFDVHWGKGTAQSLEEAVAIALGHV